MRLENSLGMNHLVHNLTAEYKWHIFRSAQSSRSVTELVSCCPSISYSKCEFTELHLTLLLRFFNFLPAVRCAVCLKIAVLWCIFHIYKYLFTYSTFWFKGFRASDQTSCETLLCCTCSRVDIPPPRAGEAALGVWWRLCARYAGIHQSLWAWTPPACHCPPAEHTNRNRDVWETVPWPFIYHSWQMEGVPHWTSEKFNTSWN